MITKTEMCNEALALIGSAGISDFDTDQKPTAQLCRALFEPTVLALLEMHPWSFALKRRVLSNALQDAPTHGFTHAFELPEDYLTMVSTGLEAPTTWSIEQRTVVTDETSLGILYIARVTDTNKFSPLFRQTLVVFLAAKLAMPLVRSTQLANMYYALMKEMLAHGENRNSVHGNELYTLDSLITVRRG